MTHIELISLLNRYKELIDQAYRGEAPSQIDPKLFEAEIFIKIGNRIILNEAYIQFINTMLKRVEYGIIFGDYHKELKQLLDYKNSFLQNGDKIYLNRIFKAIESIYLKFKRRDAEINAVISKIIHENRLNLEIVVRDAENILTQIQELSTASTQSYKILSEDIKGLDKEIDKLIVDVKIDIQNYSENLHKYIKKLEEFILRSSRKKEQNSKITSLALKIVYDESIELEAFLRSSSSKLHHTISILKREKIKTHPSPKDIKSKNFSKLTFDIFQIAPPKPKKAPKIIYKEFEPKERVVLNYQKLIRDIKREKPKDIFKFIISYDDIRKFGEDEMMSEAFKAFLLIVLEEKYNTIIESDYTEYKIRRVSWI